MADTGPAQCMTPPRAPGPVMLLGLVAPVGKPHVTVMRLYCWQHKANHTIAVADVERIVYALGEMVPDALMLGLDGDRTQAEQRASDGRWCPLTVLALTRLREGYAEHVERGVTARAEAGEWVTPDA